MIHISNWIYWLSPEQIKELNSYHNDPSKEQKYKNIRAACDSIRWSR